jgi:cyclophilin family peptidyl-prolyl cis-trans isomerase
MNTFKKFLVLLSVSFIMISCSNVGDNRNTFVSVKTTLGDIKVRLYDETPLHRDNFIRLVNMRFYEGVSFHRVIQDFMIQTGDGATRPPSAGPLNDSLNFYTLPAEFQNQLFHKKGALAAAREGNDVNPAMRSSGTQFYIIQGVKFTDQELDQAESKINNNIRQAEFIRLIREYSDSNRISNLNLTEAQIQEKASLRLFDILANAGEHKISPEQRNIYKSIGGTPRLDATYTVFGEVVEGLDVVDKIAGVKTDGSDKPLTDIKIIRMKLMKK